MPQRFCRSRNSTLFGWTVALALALCGCGADTLPQAGVEPRSPEDQLSQPYAEFRAQGISNVQYAIQITLDPDLDHYRGSNRLQFDLEETLHDLTIDFSQGTVERLTINGQEIEPSYNDAFIDLPSEQLLSGTNEVLVEFSHPWSSDGNGLYRYDDPDDGKVYLYTNLEPYEANKALPLFDQPDIKARFTLDVTAPTDWVVLSTRLEEMVEPTSDGWQRWTFPTTEIIPTYVFSLHAGPYTQWKEEGFRIPLRLFARASLAHFVEDDTEMWFDLTRRGFDFFEEYYQMPYPYLKYDQILVPDFNAGAMENVAAVTFNERGYLQRDDWSHAERSRLAMVIGHEMAHMWFGDLVTMKWWNGLWLNESFATFMGFHVGSSAMGMGDSWNSFALGRKTYAYYTDRGVSTHPIETPIPNTNSIYDSFDSITYAKGASVLRQIEFQLGPEVFRQGIRDYLAQYAEKNATLDDFVGALARAADTDLTDWAYEWLHTAGVNTIEANFSCTDGKISKMSLEQSPGGPLGLLRSQRVQVGLYREIDGLVVTEAVLPITYSGDVTELSEAVGLACPDLVYPNHGDLGYLLVKLDPATRTALATHISNLEDSLQRGMFWQSLWDSARYAEIPVTDYLETAIAAGTSEKDLTTASNLFGHATSGISYLQQMGEAGHQALSSWGPKLEAVLWSGFEENRGDLKTLFFDRYVDSVTSESGLDHLVQLLGEPDSIEGFDLDQGRRWGMVKTLNASGHPDGQAVLDVETERDSSAQGKRWLLSINTSRPELEIKRLALAKILDPASEDSYSIQRVSMAALFPTGQEGLHEELAAEILKTILEHEQNPDPKKFSFQRGFASYLLPTTCTKTSVERLEKVITNLTDGSETFLRLLRGNLEADARCVARKGLIESSS